MTNAIETMSDRELLDRVTSAARDERHITAELLRLIGELDHRRLYLGEGCSSLFTYCTQVLHLSEHAAYHRIEGARAARRFPVILDLIADGSVTLTTVALLRPHLTPENYQQLLDAARHMSKRDVEHQIACLAPKPDAKALIRKLPPQDTKKAAEPAPPVAADLVPTLLVRDSKSALRPVPTRTAAPDPQPRVAPLASDRYLLRVTPTADAYAKLRRAQQLMAHSVPSGDPAVIVGTALSILVDQLERAKIARVRRPRTRSAQTSPSAFGSRHIPAALRREVWTRDEGRCAFVGTKGRCSESRRLEFHHVVPFARGGPTTVENLALRCRAHNTYESEQSFGTSGFTGARSMLGPDRVAAPE